MPTFFTAEELSCLEKVLPENFSKKKKKEKQRKNVKKKKEIALFEHLKGLKNSLKSDFRPIQYLNHDNKFNEPLSDRSKLLNRFS